MKLFRNNREEIELRKAELKAQEDFNALLKHQNEVMSQVQYGFGSLLAPNADSSRAITEGYQTNATIFSLVDLLIKSACNVNVGVFRIADEGALKEYKSLTSGMTNDTAQIKASTLRERALIPVQNDLSKLLARPSPLMAWPEWLQEVMGFKYLTGNSFIRKWKRSGIKTPFMLEVWPAHFVQVLVDKMQVTGYKVQANDYNMTAPVDEIGHIKNFNPDYSKEGGHLIGQSPITAAYGNLGINNGAVSTGKNIIDQQGTRGILMPDDTNQMYGKEQAEQVETKYKEKHTLQGRFGKNSGILFPSIKMKYQSMGMPAADIALMEQYNVSIKDLCGVYHVPSILLNDTAESKVESFREAKKFMYQVGVFPELVGLRDELNRWLTPDFGNNLFIDFDFMSVPEVQEDMEKVTKQLNIAWWLTPNEKRGVMKFEQSNDAAMNNVYIPANLLNLSDGITGELEGGEE